MMKPRTEFAMRMAFHERKLLANYVYAHYKHHPDIIKEKYLVSNQ